MCPPGCAFERGVRVGRNEPGREGGAEPPQVFLLLDAAHGRVQVLLFTFQSVKKRAGKSKRRWWWHTQHCWAGVRVPVASLLPSSSALQAIPPHLIRDIMVPEERGPGVGCPGPLSQEPSSSTLPSLIPFGDLVSMEGTWGWALKALAAAADEVAPSSQSCGKGRGTAGGL